MECGRRRDGRRHFPSSNARLSIPFRRRDSRVIQLDAALTTLVDDPKGCRMEAAILPDHQVPKLKSE
jgi:hypothetical protein